jgi:hypothetical protein
MILMFLHLIEKVFEKKDRFMSAAAETVLTSQLNPTIKTGAKPKGKTKKIAPQMYKTGKAGKNMDDSVVRCCRTAEKTYVSP